MPVFLAPAKINLYLHVTGKRENGYHLLDSLVVFAKNLSDKITIEEARNFSFSVSGDFASEVPEDNLVTRAVQMVASETGRASQIKVHLEKNIPAGAGLGGGSADAAATIRALEAFWNMPLPKDRLNALLLSLGADVPICYHGKPCRFRGIGEIIEDVPPLPALHALIVWPNRHCETKSVFLKRSGDYSAPVSIPSFFESTGNLIDFLKTTQNDLTEAACTIEPVIREAIDFVSTRHGCLMARMSGSGSAVFGLFDSLEASYQARNACQSSHPSWFAAAIRV